MKGFLKFFALVALLVPAWIAFLSLTGEERLKQRAEVGPLVVVDEALKEVSEGLWVSDMVRMDPDAPADAWRLEGLAASRQQSDTANAQPFQVALRSACQPLSDADCWVVDRLDFTPLSDGPAVQGANGNGAASGKMLRVQQQLRELGFDPGPTDGSLGPRTREAIKDYLVKYSRLEPEAAVSDETLARAVFELEVLSILSRGQRHHAKGEYHAALKDYALVMRLDPENARAWFSRGLVYQEMGVADLAIADFSTSLDLNDGQVMAYHSRGNAQFDLGNYWHAFADHADGLGLRYIGERYLDTTQSLGAVWATAEPQLAAMARWAKGAWNSAKTTIEEKLDNDEEASEGETT